MAEKTRYELKGTLRKDCMEDTATPDGFRPLESDWRELLRWLMSVSGDLPWHDSSDNENGSLSALWENHVLTVLVDILQKDVCSYMDSFVNGRGTSAQTEYTDDLKAKFTEWARRLKEYVNRSRSTTADSPAIEVAEQLAEQLEKALPQQTVSRPQYSHTLLNDTNQPYYRMLGTVEDIQQKGGAYIARIEQSGDLDASLTLLLTFVRSYCSIAGRFNDRFGGWAEFYRKNILHDTPKTAVQDSTYILIEPDRKKGAETFPLPEGTKFAAEKKTDGSELCYATTEKAYIVPARIHAAYALFRKDHRLCAAPIPAKEQKNVQHPLFDSANPEATALEYGWLLTSRSLILEEGRRTVTVRFHLNTEEEDSPMPDLSAFDGDTRSFVLQISGSEGWKQTPHTSLYDKDTCSLRLSITLNEGEEAPAACTEELHGIATRYPALRILSADRSLPDTLPQTLRIAETGIATEVEGIRDFTLIGESGQADASQPFYPFGPTGSRDSRLIFGHGEAALKNITAVTLKGAWMKLPENGFAPIYKNYPTGKPVDEDSFRVRCEWQDGGRWHECAGSPQPLFRKEGDGKLSEEAAFELTLTEKLLANSLMPYRRDSNGFYRLTLTAPDIGFGMNAYYRLFSEVMTHNGKEKEKKHLPLPEQPQVPMLCDMTFGYKSEETIRPGADGCGLFRVSGFRGNEACGDGEDLPLFMPHLEDPSVLIGLDCMGDTNRVRLYFDLRYAVNAGMPANGQPDCTLGISLYAGNGRWHPLPQEDILYEETQGLTRSGFIELKAKEGKKGNGLWLGFSFADSGTPEGMVPKGIHLNCLRVTAEDGDGVSLPAGTITAPSREDARILSVSQPLPGSGGKPAETDADANVRQRIRISTRNRPVWCANYEEMLLERFPEIEKACCIPATGNGGEVRIVVFPKPEKREYPFLPGWKLAEIENYIGRYASPFAGIKALNPVFEPLAVHFKAVLKADIRDPGEVKRRTERRIRVFLMAWYMDGELPDLGVRYSCDALLSRILNDEGISGGEGFSLEITGGQRTWRKNSADPEDVVLSPADDCGILYIRELDIELSGCRSGVEEARIGKDFKVR